MKKIMTILSLLFISLTGFMEVAYADQEVIATKEAFRAVTTQIPDLKIIFVGDTNHEKTSLWETFALSLEDLKVASPKLDCVMLELDQRFQPFFDTFQDTHKTSFKKFIETKLSNVSISDDQIRVTEEILRRAKRWNLKVYASDVDFSSTFGQQIVNETLTLNFFPNNENNAKNYVRDVMEVRSNLFAQKADQLLKTHTCNQIVELVGAGHLDNHVPMLNASTTSLQTRVKDMGYKSTTTVLWSSKCDDGSEKTCNEFKEKAKNQSFSLLYNPAAAGNEVSFLLIAP